MAAVRNFNSYLGALISWTGLSLVICLWLSGCARSPKRATLRLEEYSGQIRVACVGDSITYGDGIEQRETKSYPAVLDQLLGPQFEVRNLGVNGATLLKKGDKPYWAQPEFQAVSEFNPDAIIVMLGTNDTKPDNWTSRENFANDLRAMVDYFTRLPSKPRIWICLPVPVYETRWGIREEVLVQEVIPAIQKVADEKEIPLIDLHDALNQRPDLFPDKIHPNAAGAALMARTIKGALLGF